MNKKQRESLQIPAHVAIILDGNGRWARKRHMPRTFGHQAGVENIRKITLAAADLGIKALSVYAFSTENWSRPQEEVDFLMKLPGEFEERFKDDFKDYDVKVMFSGRTSHLSEKNLDILNRITKNTKDRKGIILNICFDYGSYAEITQSVQKIAQDVLDQKLKPEDIEPKHIEENLYTKDLPKLDLLIRPSGEVRLSNFFLWQAAYAELYFCKTFWPAFSKKDLEKAILEFNLRDRRFGGLKK
ncbi:MAG: isoprenyl transferase [Bacilli bacterium]|nr:isoprenyl transferase [Bacilli bacterium]MBN2877022.1 isoprenyl transferase [Bacilli bacterium]